MNHMDEKQNPEEVQTILHNLSQDEQEIFEERAAIMEYDGCLPRSEAEKLSLEIILAKRK